MITNCNIIAAPRCIASSSSSLFCSRMTFSVATMNSSSVVERRISGMLWEW